MTDAQATLDAALRSRLLRYLDGLEGAVRAGESPEIVREMVAYNFAFSVIAATAAACLVGVCALLFLWTLKNWDRVEAACGYQGGVPFTVCFGSVTGSILGVCAIAVNFNTAIKCYFAPKYFVIEQIAEMVTSAH